MFLRCPWTNWKYNFLALQLFFITVRVLCRSSAGPRVVNLVITCWQPMPSHGNQSCETVPAEACWNGDAAPLQELCTIFAQCSQTELLLAPSVFQQASCRRGEPNGNCLYLSASQLLLQQIWSGHHHVKTFDVRDQQKGKRNAYTVGRLSE